MENEKKTNAGIRTKVRAIHSWMHTQLLERGAAIDALMIAALAGENAVLIGPPGTAKSMLARLFNEAVGGRYFETLLTRFSTPEELLGPFSLSGLQADRYKRQLDGRLADCEVAFLDEVFKSNAGTLNALLGVLNERVVHDDGQVKRIPLRFALGASNELPRGEEGLEALWDRFMVRVQVGYLKHPASKMALASGSLKRTPAPTMTLAEWDVAVADAKRVVMPGNVAQRLVELCGKLPASVSDRRLVKLSNLARAAAYLDECDVVDTEHFSSLQDAMWDAPEQIAEVAGVLASAISPEYSEALRKHDAVMSTVASLVAQASPDADIKVISQLSKAIDELKSIAMKLDKGSRARGKIRKLMEGMVATTAEARARSLKRIESPDTSMDF